MDKRKVFRFLRRYRIAAWIIVFVIGLSLMLLAFNIRPRELDITGTYTENPDSSSESRSGSIILINHNSFDPSDILMGIGTGIAATSLVSFLLIALLIDDTTNNLNEEWGIENIYRKRSDCKITIQSFPKSNLDIAAFGLSHLRNNIDSDVVVARINNGLHIRIITLHRESPFIQAQERFEDIQQIERDITELQKWVSEINKKIKTRSTPIEIKYYNSLPLHFYCRQDDVVYVGPYLPSTVSNETITTSYRYSSSGGQYYSKIFESIWKGEIRGVQLIPDKKKIIKTNQNEAISYVLDYFARGFQGDSPSKVRGVVAIFKDPARKTFYSTSFARGESEKHSIRHIKDGAIERLKELNKNANEESYTFLFKDYERKCSVKQINKVFRGMKEIRRDDNLNESRPMSTDSTKYILLSPLIIDDEMIGAITFDFVNMCTEYSALQTQILKGKEKELYKTTDVSLMADWFNDLEDCKNIMERMIGHYIQSDYQELEGGKWDV